MSYKKSKILGLVAMLCCIAAVASAASFLVTTVQVARLGTFTTTTQGFDSTAGGAVGCQVRLYNAGDSVRIGQVVQFTAKNTVAASATLADYNDVAGIVVGGTRTNLQASYVVADTSTLAATSGQRVWVCYNGRTYVLVDTVTDGIGPGIQIIPSLVKGRVKGRSTAIDSFNRIFGKMVDTGLRNKAALANINVK